LLLPESARTKLDMSLAGQVVVPADPLYEWTRKPFIARFDDVLPQLVVRCAAPDDAVEALAFADRHELPIAIRSGGHCFAGYSSTSGLLIDVTLLNQVTVDGDTAVVGAGARVGAMTERLAEHNRVVPCGSCPSVGVGGTTLGGGLGVLGRLYGLTCDHLLAAQVVLADGRVVHTDE
jgi:FAD/FMN-containing dehydrogenase